MILKKINLTQRCLNNIKNNVHFSIKKRQYFTELFWENLMKHSTVHSSMAILHMTIANLTF